MGMFAIYGRCLRCAWSGLQQQSANSVSRFHQLPSATIFPTSSRLGAAAIPRTITCISTRSLHFLRNIRTNPAQIVSLTRQKLRSLLLGRNLKKKFAGDGRPSKSLKDLKFSDIRAIYSLVWPYRWRVFGAIVLLGINSTLLLSLPKILGKVIDDFDEAKRKRNKDDITAKVAHFFRENLLILTAVLLLGASAIAIRIYLMHTTGQLVVNDLRSNVYRSILHQDMAFFDRSKVGEIISRLSSDAYVVGNTVSSNLSDGLRALMTIGGSGGMMIYTSPALSALGFVYLFPVLGIIALHSNYQRKFTHQMQEVIADTNQLATERLSNVRTVRAFVAEAKELKSYGSRIQEIWTVSQKEGFAKALVIGSSQLTGYSFLILLIYFGGKMIQSGVLSHGDLSAFLLYGALCIGGLSTLQGFSSELMRGLGASARLFELRDMKPNIPITGGTLLKDLKKEIRFESVAFAYPGRDPIFNDVTFRIPASSTTAIVGPSGCGKSTIAHLLLRLYSPTQGRICVDEHDLRDLDPSAWRRIIGTVSQEPVLFSATIRDNILYGLEEEEAQKVSEEELHEAAEQSNSLEFIRAFPDGFDTMVGEHGASMLSGGQRQRIAIARALIKKPRILILDEATSALDATSEYLVRKALDTLLAKSGQTVLIIAHRLSTIKHAGQIVVLDTGTVAELGNFDTLMSIKNGIFYRLVEKQTFDWRVDKF